ncbi:exonuclease domain-containing protein [Streptomyces violaceusniger]|uniref:Exonuclease RNase T and DNA polymerase III n=1 Tax=Streptomyces violaceusniger (strain Tu 4113) TaxID=653045 RepID=G2PHX4_STRV4|nr:exonuclease domain-containing protein [Streptomyces violaceusniger]AEM88925.1 Exonuclease RNase T and DNA polymerase III [Streptomyces violaceusniger Tu 4113]
MSFEEHDIPPVLLGFDTETTGLDVFKDRIVQAALVGQDRSGREVFREEWLINPGILIPREATKIHGITSDRAMEDGQDPAEAIEQITGLLEKALRAGCALVIQNAPYDLALLDAEAQRHSVVPLAERRPVAPVLDPVMLAKVAKVEGRHSLAALSARFGVTNPRAHTAYADAVTTLAVLRKLMMIDVLDEEPAVLHVMQEDEARRRAESWQEELRVSDPCARVAPGWPLSAGRTRIGCECRDCGRPLTDSDLTQPCGECLERFAGAVQAVRRGA